MAGIKEISAQFSAGEFVAITGASGSGKSTLLNVLAGTDNFNDGSMSVCDEKLKAKIHKVLKTENIYDILQMTIANREKTLRKIMGIPGANALQVSRITGVPYHFLRYLQ